MYCFTYPTQILRTDNIGLQLPLRIVHYPSIANGGATVPAPMMALPFRHPLTFVHPTPVPTSPHQVHLSHLSLVRSNQPANGGAPVMSLPLRRVLTTVHPSPTKAPSSPSFPSVPSVPYVPSLHLAIIIQSNPADTIQFQFQRYPAIKRYPSIQQ